MPSICPKDCKPCIDDLCRGSGTCMRTGTEMWEQCSICHQVYSEEYGVECACDPDDDYADDDDPTEAGAQ